MYKARKWIVGIIGAFALAGAISCFLDKDNDVGILLSVVTLGAVIFILKAKD
jgi:hypothetical protein